MTNNFKLVNVLDHGYVRLVDSMGNDLSIVRSARVSYSADWRTGENEGSDKKLIKFLWKNKHTSPFESVEFQFEIKCPIFIARQWHRHRTFSYNEVSARYTELPEEFYVPTPDIIGQQSAVNKQVRDINIAFTEAVKRGEKFACIMREANEEAFHDYKRMLAEGCPRELARSVLPLATYTRFFAKGNLRNWIHFLELRDDSHAQYEIRVYAAAIKQLIRQVIPVTWEILYGDSNTSIPPIDSVVS